jgi:osmotically-inducible protein OsmY
MARRSLFSGQSTVTGQLAIRRGICVKRRAGLAIGVLAMVVLTATGCAVRRGQQDTWAYIDDSAITARIKSRFVENRQVDAVAIGVETLNGVVMLSGFPRTLAEKQAAEEIARSVHGVVLVKSQLLVHP